MRKIILYIASSIDGYIADKDGSIEWLTNDDNGKEDYGYQKLIDSIDTTLMGYKTYEKVLTFDEFPYKDKMNYVITTKNLVSEYEYIEFINMYAVRRIKEMKEADGKDIWLIGGGKLNSVLMDNDLVDEIILFIKPIILGSGIPLFSGQFPTPQFDFIESKTYNSGLVEFKFKKRV